MFNWFRRVLLVSAVGSVLLLGNVQPAESANFWQKALCALICGGPAVDCCFAFPPACSICAMGGMMCYDMCQAIFDEGEGDEYECEDFIGVVEGWGEDDCEEVQH